MNDSDILKVEAALGKHLPEEYKRVLASYPFGPDSFGTMCMLADSASTLIEMNKSPSFHSMLHPKATRSHPLPQDNFLWIGNDGGEEEYYLDLSRDPAPVMKFDLETGEFAQYAADIHDYVEKTRAIDREIEEDEKRAEERRRTAKWWQFWRKL